MIYRIVKCYLGRFRICKVSLWGVQCDKKCGMIEVNSADTHLLNGSFDCFDFFQDLGAVGPDFVDLDLLGDLGSFLDGLGLGFGVGGFWFHQDVSIRQIYTYKKRISYLLHLLLLEVLEELWGVWAAKMVPCRRVYAYQWIRWRVCIRS